MKDIITKELLSEVLNIEVKNVSNKIQRQNRLYYIAKSSDGLGHRRYINIHELCEKMILWAFKEDFILKPYMASKFIYACEFKHIDDKKYTFSTHDTKHEVISFICNHILKLKNKEEK